jgi:transposase
MEENLLARQSNSKAPRPQQTLPTIHTRAAGIDVGSTFHGVAVPPALSSAPVRTFQSFPGA